MSVRGGGVSGGRTEIGEVAKQRERMRRKKEEKARKKVDIGQKNGVKGKRDEKTYRSW